jgi:hypothetical protein
MDPMYFIAVGVLLGTIHAASSDANRQSISKSAILLLIKLFSGIIIV